MLLGSIRNRVTRNTGMNKNLEMKKIILRPNCWCILINFFRYRFEIFYPICCFCKRSAASSTLYIGVLLDVHKCLSSFTRPSTSLLEYTTILFLKLIISFACAGGVIHLNLLIKNHYYRDALYLTNAVEVKLFSMKCLKKKIVSRCFPQIAG